MHENARDARFTAHAMSRYPTLDLGARTVKLVPAGAEDIDVAERLVFANMQPYLRDADLAWESERFRQGFASSDNYLLHLNTEIIGFLSLNYAANHTYVRELQLNAAYRRRGIGSWLIGEVERLSRQRGLYLIRLRVLRSNPAQAFYARQGFSVAHREDATLGMEKRLPGH